MVLLVQSNERSCCNLCVKMSLLEALVLVSEKAANIARICRQDQHLFGLLVQEKGDDSNPRFVHDFKTLADVLIQEVVISNIGNQFPKLKQKIKGEENNSFTNTLGETITVEIKDTEEETADLLELVLNGDRYVADLLATEVFREIQLENVYTEKCTKVDFDIDLDDLGIWIDPIDSTSEYVNGIENQHVSGIYTTGLRCVTVLIGGFSISTGKSIIGIINHPFHEMVDENWIGTCHWGISTSTTSTTSIPANLSTTNLICISSNETSTVRTTLTNAGYTLLEVAGAGYKALTVILGQCDAYVLSRGSTYMWDTCGTQAVLKALGGNMMQFSGRLSEVEEVVYSVGSEDKLASCGNVNGVIACRSGEVLKKIVGVLRELN